MRATTIVGLLFVCAGLATVLLVPQAARNREKPGATGFLITATGIILWCVAAGIQITAGRYWLAISAANFTLLGASLSGVGWFLLGGEYTESVTLSPTVGLLASAEPVVSQLLVWTNPWHHLMWGPETTIGPTGVLQIQFGPAFWVHTAVLYVLMNLVTLLLVGEAVRASGIRRAQSVTLVGGWVPPVVLTAVYVFDVIELSYDPTPLGFVLTAFLFAWALFEARFLDIVPIARETATERMNDAFVTLDSNDRVIDCNSAARDLAGIDGRVTGMSGVQFFHDVPEFIQYVTEQTAVDTELAVNADGDTQYFELDISPIRKDGRVSGRFLVIRDITAQKRRQQVIEHREEQLDVLRQVLTRIFRHNIRNDLNSAQIRAEMLQEELDGENRELVESIISEIQGVTDLSEKVQKIDDIVKNDTMYEIDLVTLVGDLISSLEDTYPNADVSVELPAVCYARVHPQVGTAILELLENAVEHNDTREPTVSVTLTENKAKPVLTISDNGPGIPQHELDVLDNEQETPLHHGSGIGLWQVKLLANSSPLDIEFDIDRGTTVTIHFGTDA